MERSLAEWRPVARLATVFGAEAESCGRGGGCRSVGGDRWRLDCGCLALDIDDQSIRVVERIDTESPWSFEVEHHSRSSGVLARDTNLPDNVIAVRESGVLQRVDNMDAAQVDGQACRIVEALGRERRFTFQDERDPDCVRKHLACDLRQRRSGR